MPAPDHPTYDPAELTPFSPATLAALAAEAASHDES